MSKYKKRLSYIYGYLAEIRVIIGMMLLGYTLIAHRYKTKYGEIDIIMKRRNALRFIEVKARSSVKLDFHISDIITKYQSKRLHNAMQYYLSKSNGYRFSDIKFICKVVGYLCIYVKDFTIDDNN